MKSQRLLPDDPLIQFKSALLQTFPAARMTGIQHRELISSCHCVYRAEQGSKILLRIDVFLPVSAQQNVLPFFQSQTFMNVGRLYLRQICPEYFRHWRTAYKSTLFRQTAVRQIPPGMFGICDIYIRNNVYNASVCLFRQTFVLASVSGLHMENRDMQALCPNNGQAGICIPEYQHRIRTDLGHQLVRCGQNPAHCLSQVIARAVQIDIRLSQPKILKENSIKIIVVILPCMRQYQIEIQAALFDHLGKPDNFRPGADNDQKLQLSVILKFL